MHDTVGEIPPPVAGRKPQQILAAARRQFMEHGFGAASMDAIARDAEVSKATLYAHFASKEDLFAATVMAECRAQVEAAAALADADDDVRGVLLALGRGVLRLILSPAALKGLRIVTAEAARFPALGRIFYASGPQRVRDRLAAHLARAAARGALDVPDPTLAAEQFLGMLQGHCQLRCLLGIEQPDPAALEHRLEQTVAGFLRMYGPADLPAVRS